MSTANAVRARLLALWESFLHLRTQEEDRWRESVGDVVENTKAEEATTKSEQAACSRTERPQALAELVAQRQQEVATPIQSESSPNKATAPDLTALIAQRQLEHRANQDDEADSKDR